MFRFLVLLILWVAPVAQAQLPIPTNKKELIEKNKEVSGKIDRAATYLDKLLSGRDDSEKINTTTFRFENTLDLAEGEDPEFNPKFSVSLHLPNLEERWKLRFTTYAEDDEERGVNKNRIDTEPEREAYGASLALFESIGKVRTSFRPRIEYDKGLQTSYLLRIRTSMHAKDFSFLPEMQFFARSDSGTGQFLAFNFSIPINDRTGLLLINEQQYTANDHFFTVSHGFRAGYRINDVMNQGLSLIYEYDNKPAYHLRRYTLSTSFYHNLYNRVLTYSITPYMQFAESRKFSLLNGVLLRATLIF